MKSWQVAMLAVFAFIDLCIAGGVCLLAGWTGTDIALERMGGQKYVKFATWTNEPMGLTLEASEVVHSDPMVTEAPLFATDVMSPDTIEPTVALGVPVIPLPIMPILPGETIEATITTGSNTTPIFTDTPTWTLFPSATIVPSSTSRASDIPRPTETIRPSATYTLQPTDTLTPRPTSTATVTISISIPAACTCQSDTLNCTNADFPQGKQQAQMCYEYCKNQTGRDVYGLDHDGDGEACDAGLE